MVSLKCPFVRFDLLKARVLPAVWYSIPLCGRNDLVRDSLVHHVCSGALSVGLRRGPRVSRHLKEEKKKSISITRQRRFQKRVPGGVDLKFVLLKVLIHF